MSEKGNATPGDRALSAMKNLQKDIVFKTPNIPRKKMKQKVLDEDSYIEVILSFFFFIKTVCRVYGKSIISLFAQSEG